MSDVVASAGWPQAVRSRRGDTCNSMCQLTFTSKTLYWQACVLFPNDTTLNCTDAGPSWIQARQLAPVLHL